MMALPPVGSAITSPQVLHFTACVAWLKTTCSLSQLRQRTRINRLVGLGIRLSHSDNLLYLRFLESDTFTHLAFLAFLALKQ